MTEVPIMGNLVYHLSYFLQVLVLSLFWVYRLKRRRLFVLRAFISVAVSGGLTVLISFLDSLLSVDNWIIFSLPYIFIMLLFAAVYAVCFDISADKVFLILLLPTTAQLCASSIATFSANYVDVPYYFRDIAVTAVMCVVSFCLSRAFNEVHFYDPTICKVALIMSYSVVVCLFVLNGFSQFLEDVFARRVVIQGYRFLMSVFVYFLIFSLLVLSRTRYQKSLSEILLKKEEQQHALTKELTELINIKHHDLKHMSSSGAASEFLAQDKKLLDIYDLLVDCGNDALNTILTEKNTICKNNNIKLTIMVDGDLLSFMPSADIYVLFGNALDNAIEYLVKLPEEDRHVKLQVKGVGEMVSILCENTCRDKLKFENGLPRTTKTDTYNHGFGTKSIANICKKYKAEFRMTSDGQSFTLSVLIPSKNK